MKINSILVNGKKTIHYLQKNGLRHTFYAAKERMEQEKNDHYSFELPSEKELEEERKWAAKLLSSENGNIEGSSTPLFSILVPTFETKEPFLYALLDSICEQTYPNWELILADASRSDLVKTALEAYCAKKQESASNDSLRKIKYCPLKENKGISDNTNAGLEFCEGEYICLVDHDDLLTPDALYWLAKEIVDKTEKEAPVMIYSDEDKTNTDGTVFYDCNNKYKFNLDLILSNNYICHLTAIRADLFKELKERPAFDGAQDFDLVLRVVSYLIENYKGMGGDINDFQGLLSYLQDRIHHVPRVLYHWRCHSDSTAENTASKRYAYEAGLRAVQDFMERHGFEARVSHSLHLGFYNVEYKPSLLRARADVAVVGGRILDRHNKMKACIQNEKGEYLYVGTHREYSGRMHRFSMLQDVACVDLRCAKLSDQAVDILSKQLGMDCKKYMKDDWFDAKAYEKSIASPKTLDWPSVNKEFCEQIRQNGYTIVYDPKFETKG